MKRMQEAMQLLRCRCVEALLAAWIVMVVVGGWCSQLLHATCAETPSLGALFG
jgi:hypothetical protein